MVADLPSMACRGGCRGRGAGSGAGGEIGSGAGDTVIRGSGILARGMRGGIWSRLGAGAAVLALTSCGSAAGAGALPVPTFPAVPTAAASGGAGAADQGRLPDDCARLLAGNDLGALFGLPLDSVTVRTTIGTPAPAVGRTERLGCSYTRTGGPRATCST